MGLIEQFRNLFNRSGPDGSRRAASSRLLVLLAVGIGLLVFNSFFSSGKKDAAPSRHDPAPPAGGRQDERQAAQELAAVLNQIRGVSNVRIYLTEEASGRLEVLADSEKVSRQTDESDSGGGSRLVSEETLRLTHVIMRDLQGKETPLVVGSTQPRYRGVLVVADGVGDPAVRAQVVEALQAVLGLPYHRITVLPRD